MRRGRGGASKGAKARVSKQKQERVSEGEGEEGGAKG